MYQVKEMPENSIKNLLFWLQVITWIIHYISHSNSISVSTLLEQTENKANPWILM